MSHIYCCCLISHVCCYVCRLVDYILAVLICLCVEDLLQVHRVMIEASNFRYLWRLGRVFNIYPIFVLDLNHSDQWNTLLSAGGEIFQLTNLVTPLGLKIIPRRRRYLECNASIVTLCTCNKASTHKHIETVRI